MLGIDLSPIYEIVNSVVKGIMPFIVAAILVKKWMY